jgi:hypothetical protein
MGVKAKPVGPRSLATRVLLQVVVVAVLGLVPTCATMSVAPVATRLAAPLVCPSGTERSEVVARWGGNAKGGASLRWDLFCLTHEGLGSVPSTARIFFGVLGLWSAIVIVIGLLLRGRKLLAARGRRDGEGQGHAA